MSNTISTKELKDVFASLDFDGDGLISRKELALAVRALGRNPTERELNDFFGSLDQSQTSIDFTTFKRASEQPFKTPFEQDRSMRDSFKILDVDGDGTILESELRQMLLTVGEAMTHTEVDSLLEDLSVDHNGKIQYDKLIDILVNSYAPGQDSIY